MADEDGDKTEAPTPRRRTEAREQGNIARSPDVTAAVLLIASIVLLNWWGPGMMNAMRTLMAEMLASDSIGNYTTESALLAGVRAIRLMAGAMAPLLLGVAFVAIIINIAQVGLILNFKRIQPQIGGLNPMKGFKKLFSFRDNGVQMAMNLCKLGIVGFVAYSAVHNKMGLILRATELSFLQIFALGAAVVYSIAIRIGVALLVLAILDYIWQRWKHEQQLKMSKQEIKDEMRRMEGDPKIKSRRRQIAMQRIMQGVRKNVPTADVIVTNPTHYAVALKYDANSMNAPRVVAKGADLIAQTIREIAIANGIPILERPPLARALYRMCDIGSEVPEQFYSAIAEILAYVYELSGKARIRAAS